MGNLKFNIDDTCVKCGACAEDCPVQCITEGKTRFIIGKGCIGCGDCYSICPVGAVKMYKRETPKKLQLDIFQHCQQIDLHTESS